MFVRKILSACKNKITNLLFRAMRFLPLKRNRVFFQSYEKADGFIDNPKYLCQYMYDTYKERFEYIFALKILDDTDVKYIHKVRYGSLKWRYYLSTSKVIVVNCWMPTWLTRKKNQLVINTWHAGGPFKSIGIHRVPELCDVLEKRMNNFANTFVSTSQAFTTYIIMMGFHFQGEILTCGMPRNDLLFSCEFIQSCSDKIRSQYGFGNALCVLYAPTFRRNPEKKIIKRPPLAIIANILKEKYSKDVVILLRNHRWDNNQYEIPGVTFNVSSYPDTQELLCCSDILITDYSSTMWDFALLGRPCFLFVPDKEEYEKDQGVFTPIEEWPGILCHDENELLKEITELDPERSRNIAEQYLKKSGSYENGTAASTIAEYIYRNTISQEKD